VVWFEPGGAAVLAVIGLPYLALAWYLTRFRANPPLLFRMDHEGLHAFAAGNPTVRIQLGGRVARVRWLELAEVRTRLKTGGLSLQLHHRRFESSSPHGAPLDGGDDDS
jgi:hypothetical protein